MPWHEHQSRLPGKWDYDCSYQHYVRFHRMPSFDKQTRTIATSRRTTQLDQTGVICSASRLFERRFENGDLLIDGAATRPFKTRPSRTAHFDGAAA
jgi:hypothetical protein